jgi:hypothetical protein
MPHYQYLLGSDNKIIEEGTEVECLDDDAAVAVAFGRRLRSDAIEGRGRLGPRMEVLIKPFQLGAFADRVKTMIRDAMLA